MIVDDAPLLTMQTGALLLLHVFFCRVDVEFSRWCYANHLTRNRNMVLIWPGVQFSLD